MWMEGRERKHKKKRKEKHHKEKKKHKKEEHREKRRKRKDAEPPHATKEAKVAGRLFAAINRCGSGQKASTTSAAALHDVRYYTARLLRLGTDPTLVVDETGRTLLHRAVLQNNATLCRYLIDTLGRDMVNLVSGSEDASTALHYACLNESAEICHMLHRSGAETGIKNALGIVATEIGFEALRRKGEQLEAERQQREAEWRAMDERMKAGGFDARDTPRRHEDATSSKRRQPKAEEEPSDDDDDEQDGEEDFHVFDYTELGKKTPKKKRKRPGTADDGDAFERWKEMERNKWRRQQEEQDWNERLAEEFASEGGHMWHDQWADMDAGGGGGNHLSEEEWKDWVRKEMGRKASRRWGQDHGDFYDAKARKRREEERKERERREREKERETKERIEREEKEREAQRQKVEAKRQADDWKRLEREWVAFEEALNARRKEGNEASDLGLADIPFPDIERDEETGHTLGGFNFMTEETTADDKTKFLRTLFLRWHPDKFEQRVGHRLKQEEKVQVLAHATRITQHITRLKDLLAKQTSAPPE